MNRRLLLGLLVLISFFIGSFSVKAAVNPIAGCVDPQVSTAEEPVWYTIMSSHLTDADRQNRFLVWDGTRLKTEKFDSGILESQLENKYLWRLEKGSADNKVYIVNRAGMRVFAEDGISPNTGANTLLTVTETGVEWVMALSSSTGQPDCADKQYCFNYLGASAQPAYLNAMDSQNGDTQKAYGVTVYEMGVHQASGWFFYKAELPAYNVTYEGTVVGGSFVVKNGDAIVESGSSVEEGTWLTVEATPDVNYQVKAIKVNGVAIDGSGFTLSEASEITVEFMNEQVYTVTYPTELTGGKLKVTQDSDGEEIPSGTELQKNTAITISVVLEPDYEISALFINGVDRLQEFLENGAAYWITIAEDVEINATFTPLTGIKDVQLANVYFDSTTSVLYSPESSLLRVYNITGSLVYEGKGTQNLQNLSEGTYIAKVKMDNGVRTIKFIKK